MKNFLLLFSILWVANTYAQTKNNIVFSLEHKVGNDPLVINQSVFTIWNNKKVILTRAEFYISEVEMHLTDGSMIPLVDHYILADASKSSTEYHMGDWQAEEIQGVKLHLGVDPAHNHEDPTNYLAGHPLALKDPTMHWGWTAGYRFMALEGKIDNNGDGKPETVFEIHNVGDALYKTVELQMAEKAKDGIINVKIVLDYAQLFKNIAMTGNLIQHGTYTLNSKVMSNAALEKFISSNLSLASKDVLENSKQVSINPNPVSTSSVIKYSLPSLQPISMVIMNALGQTIQSFENLPQAGIVNFQRENLPNGLFQCVFYDHGKLLARNLFTIIK